MTTLSHKHGREETTASTVVPKRRRRCSHTEAKHIAVFGESNRWTWTGRAALAHKLPTVLVDRVCEFLSIEQLEQQMWQLEHIASGGPSHWDNFFFDSVRWTDTARMSIVFASYYNKLAFARLPAWVQQGAWEDVCTIISQSYANIRAHLSPDDQTGSDLTQLFIKQGVREGWTHPVGQIYYNAMPEDIIKRLEPPPRKELAALTVADVTYTHAAHDESSPWSWGGRSDLAIHLPTNAVDLVCQFLDIDRLESRMKWLDRIATGGPGEWRNFFHATGMWAWSLKPMYIHFKHRPYHHAYARLPAGKHILDWQGLRDRITKFRNPGSIWVDHYYDPRDTDLTQLFIDRGVCADWSYPADGIYQTLTPTEVIKRLYPVSITPLN